MKKTFVIAVMVLTAFWALPALAASDWDSFVAQMESEQRLKTDGPVIVAQVAQMAPQATDKELWNLSCNAPSVETRAAASVALVNKLFPSGDPSRWQEVQGFFPPQSYIPLQLVAVNALYNAVTALSQMPNGKLGAAYLMTQFGKSAIGKLYFVDNMPSQFRKTMDTLVAETPLAGDWSSETIEGTAQIVPVYNNVIVASAVQDNNNFQFINGMGLVANEGPYSWDRAHGYIYKLVRSDGSTKGNDGASSK